MFVRIFEDLFETLDDNIAFEELRVGSFRYQSEKPAPSPSPANLQIENNEPALQGDIQVDHASQGDINVLEDEGQPGAEKEPCSESER